jgi:hypothetical protein
MPFTIIFTHVKKNSLGIPDVLRGCGEDEGRAGHGGGKEKTVIPWG